MPLIFYPEIEGFTSSIKNTTSKKDEVVELKGTLKSSLGSTVESNEKNKLGTFVPHPWEDEKGVCF